MGILITAVQSGTPAHKAGIRAGDTLVSIDGHPISDVLDYMYYAAQAKLKIGLSDRTVKVKKGEYDDLGLEFDSFLMDDSRPCRNKCVFCFIDQLPKGMRPSLYFKDDDARLSFLQGNYITLTNLTDMEVERIIQMRLSVNVSVHTTNPELRSEMMGNRHAGAALAHLHRMAQAGILLNCQLVLCPGLNDGKELVRSIEDLSAYPNVQSIAVVPVGLSKYRQGLYPLRPFDEQTAADVIDIVESFHDKLLNERGSRVVFPSDEFFLLAHRKLPDEEYYEDFPQYENGVGIITMQGAEFSRAMQDTPADERVRHVSIATGVAAAENIASLLEISQKKWHNLKGTVYPIVNDFFGHGVTVAGLVTGGDLIAQLTGKDLGERLLIPRVMLRAQSEVFLDDVTVSQVEQSLGVPVVAVDSEGDKLLEALLK